MRKIKALFLSLVMLVGICALPMKANAACVGYDLTCGDYTEAGIICGSSMESIGAALEQIMSEVC